jgi:hypothetical protein
VQRQVRRRGEAGREEFGVTLRLQHVEVEAGERMLTMHLKHFNSRGVTLLFSHGNAVDIGLLRDHFLGLCCELHVDVFAYEYSGYGTSTGVASEVRSQATAMQKLRIVTLGFGTARQKRVLERRTNPTLSRRSCSPRYGLQSCRGKSAGVAKRPRELISPTRNPLRYDSQLVSSLHARFVWAPVGSFPHLPWNPTDAVVPLAWAPRSAQ